MKNHFPLISLNILKVKQIVDGQILAIKGYTFLIHIYDANRKAQHQQAAGKRRLRNNFRKQAF